MFIIVYFGNGKSINCYYLLFLRKFMDKINIKKIFFLFKLVWEIFEDIEYID